MSNHHVRDPLAETSQENRGHDPIRASWREAPDFNKAWLRNGESLRPMQRVGFVLISILFLCFALFCSNACRLNIVEGTVKDGGLFWSYFFGLATLIFSYLACAGLKNALKRKQKN
jgi:hypothetical protein